MAINFSNTGTLVSGAGNGLEHAAPVDWNGAWTVSLWVRPHTTTPDTSKPWGDYRQYYLGGAYAWVYIGSGNSTNDVILELGDGDGYFVDIGLTPLPLGMWTHLAATYDPVTHTASLYVNHVLDGAVVEDITGWDFVGGGDWDAVGREWGDYNIAQVRVWNAVLTNAERRAEADATLAVRHTDLIFDSPLASADDYLEMAAGSYLDDWYPFGVAPTTVTAPPTASSRSLTPNFWVEERIVTYPEEDVQTRYFSTQPLARGSGPFKEGRIANIGVISRSLSDGSGNWVRGRFTWEETDADRANRILMDDDATDTLLNRVISVYIQSEESRAVDGDPYTAFRGLAQEHTFTPMRAGRTAVDWLGSRLSPFNVDKKLLENRKRTRGIYPDLNEELIDTVMPLIIGEHSDFGRENQAVNYAEAAWAFLGTTGNLADGDTVTIDSKVYTIQATLTNVDGHVLRGGTVNETLEHLNAAINLGSGSGTLYAAATTLHPSCNAAMSSAGSDWVGSLVSLRIKANVAGTAGNSIPLSETSTNAWWFNEGGVPSPTLMHGLDGGTTTADAGRGQVKATFVGQRVIQGMGTPGVIVYPYDSVTVTRANVAPPDLNAVVVGPSGSRIISYAATAFTPSGQTNLGNVVTVANAPDTLTGTNYVALTVTPPALHGEMVTAYGIYVMDGGGEPHFQLTVLTNGGAYDGGETTYSDAGSAPHFNPPAPPPTNTASYVIDGVGDPVLDAEVWGMYEICGHAVNPADMHQLYGPLWTSTEEPWRGLYEEGMFGVDILAPGRLHWPHPTPYVEVTDSETGRVHRLTVMYARGPRDFYARQGKAGFAWNMCGVEDVGDGTGESIRKASFALQHILSEWVVANGGDGYFTGDWAGLPLFPGTTVSMVDTDSIQRFQDFTIEELGDIGYKFDYIFDKEMTVGELLSKFNANFEVYGGTNKYGQYTLAFIDTRAGAATGNVYRSGMEIETANATETDYTELENRITYQYEYNNEEGKFIRDPVKIEHQPSRNKYGSWYEGTVDLHFIRDRLTAEHAMARRLARKAFHQVYQTFSTRLVALRDDVGSRIAISHPYGLGAAGWQDTPFMVVRVDLDARRGLFTMRAMRISRYVDTT